jgi:hypoxanthine-DNA glycosylase
VAAVGVAARLVKQGLPPAIPKTARVLLLGSFPGEESLRQSQYYAHPRNQFWRLLGDVMGEPLVDLPYTKRLQQLALRRVGVWDIITRCERPGSLDGDIRNAALAQFDWLADHAPNLRLIAMNGKKAGSAQRRIGELGYETLVLPSSSPAYTLSYAEKLRAWQMLAVHMMRRE